MASTATPSRANDFPPKTKRARRLPAAQADTWQAKKSKIAQHATLKAAAECLAEEGYGKFSFDAVGRRAGLSQGGMQYHFKSRLNLIRLMMRHIFDEHFEHYRMAPRADDEPITLELHKKRLETEWRYLQQPYYTCFAELAMAGRTDPALRKIVQQEYRRFLRRGWKQSMETMPEWLDDMEKLEFASDLASTLLEGIRVRQLFGQSHEKRDARLREYLTRAIAAIFESGVAAPPPVMPRSK